MTWLTVLLSTSEAILLVVEALTFQYDEGGLGKKFSRVVCHRYKIFLIMCRNGRNFYICDNLNVVKSIGGINILHYFITAANSCKLATYMFLEGGSIILMLPL